MTVLRTPERIQLVWQAGEHGLIDEDAATSPLPSMDKDFQVEGTSASGADCAYDAEYGLILTTAGGTTNYEQDVVIPVPGTDNFSLWREITWGTDREVEYEAVIRTTSLETLQTIQVGLMEDTTRPTPLDLIADNNIVMFSHDEENDTNWQCNVSNTGSEAAADSGVVVVADTTYHFAIRIARDRRARFYINDMLVYTSAALKDSTDLIPFIAIEAGEAQQACDLILIAQAISRNLGA